MLGEAPRWINGGQFRNERGVLSFVNEFNLSPFVRFYCIQTNASRIVRAWQGHKYEQKAFFCLEGRVTIAAVKIDNWESPSLHLAPKVFRLNSNKPGILLIPGGWANGIKPITPSVQLLVFSDKSVVQSMNDDFRFNINFWVRWETL